MRTAAASYMASGLRRVGTADPAGFATLTARQRRARSRTSTTTLRGSAVSAVAAMSGRHYVIPHDVVEVAEAALAHRVITVDGDGTVRGGREVVAECLAKVPAPTA